MIQHKRWRWQPATIVLLILGYRTGLRLEEEPTPGKMLLQGCTTAVATTVSIPQLVA